MVKDGIVDQNALDKAKINKDQLEETIREHGAQGIENVKVSVLEVDGNISVISEDKDNRQTQYSRIRRKNKRKYH